MSSHNIPFLNIKMKIIQNNAKSATVGLFQWTQERVRNSRGKRAISVRANEVLLYFNFNILKVILSKCHSVNSEDDARL